ncbi:hypothetical protein KTT_32110 [Tengunoibacter tsumagoiensis]|uniref:RHS repeat-associated core domain-containing protein n=1 Tax=Tengunoibacter tsumagoiensis TaxID=2014871 RepID=A0A402A2Q2_9CHLR|nr:hypothetical protein KTT_32110 [Tengunoibacter tsumagoiensis]
MQETLKGNPYGYADNNPVNEVDPSGRFSLTYSCIQDFVSIGGGATAISGLTAFFAASLFTPANPTGAVALGLTAAAAPGGAAIIGIEASLFIGLSVTVSIFGILQGINGIQNIKKDCKF